MQITASMVRFLLEQGGYNVSLSGNDADEVTHARLQHPGKRRADALYVADAKPTNARKGAPVLYGEDGTYDAVELLEAAAEAMLKLQQWDIALKEALADGLPLADILLIAEEVIPYVFGLYDRNVSVLGASSNFEDLIQALYDDGSRQTAELAPGVLPSDVLANLFEDEEYHRAAELTEPFYFDGQGGKTGPEKSYCVNFFVDGQYTARLVVTDPAHGGKLDPGAELLVTHFARYLSEALERFTGSVASPGDQRDSLHTMFRDLFYSQRSLDASAIDQTLAAHGWHRTNHFTVVKFEFFEAVNWETAALFICGQLEQTVPGSCAMPYGRSIAWVVNETLLSRHDPEADYMAVVVDTIRTYACKAGISNGFDDFAYAQFGYRECEAALLIGQMRDPHLWYYRFDAYTLDYLLRKASEELPPEVLASQNVRTLIEVDERDGTEYVNTLRTFLSHKQNASHTAEALYMHRTSLLRRLERIEKIAGIDFDDPDKVLYTVLSLKLLAQ